MKTYNAIIVDDEPTAREILENHLQKIDKIKVVATCKNAIEAFAIINKEEINLIFLDINMPEISGLSFAKSIDKNIKIIFTTAYREYAVDGFDLQAVDYLLKPISLKRLIKAINKFLGENIPEQIQVEPIVSQEKNDFIFVRSERRMIKIDFATIYYIESLTDYIKIHTSNGLVVTRETISGIETKLPHKDFLRCHRSFIISISKINSFSSEYIEINNNRIPISRTYKKGVIERLHKM